jgi:YbgC/YbaW family acyl-CoA thioester hydrolase
MQDRSRPASPSADPRDLTGRFAHEVVIEVRFADTDAMRHVNNAKYLTYCEAARIRYWSDVTGEPFTFGSGGEGSLILADAKITYRAQARYGEVVTVQSRATRIGRTSFTLQHRLVAGSPGAESRLVAVSESVLVRYDYDTDRPIPLSAEHIAAIETFEGRALR